MTHTVSDKKVASKEAIVSALKKATTPVSFGTTTPASKEAKAPVSKEAKAPALKKATTPVSFETTTPVSFEATTPVSFETTQILMKILLIFIEIKSIYKDSILVFLKDYGYWSIDGFECKCWLFLS